MKDINYINHETLVLSNFQIRFKLADVNADIRNPAILHNF